MADIYPHNGSSTIEGVRLLGAVLEHLWWGMHVCSVYTAYGRNSEVQLYMQVYGFSADCLSWLIGYTAYQSAVSILRKPHAHHMLA